MKHGETKLNYLNSLKVALVTVDEIKLAELIDTMPQFDTLQEMEEATFLLAQVHEYFTNSKNELGLIMSKTKKHMAFLKSASDEIHSNFKKSC